MNAERPSASDTQEQFGRRVEADGRWTVYHVFTGVPAVVAGYQLSDLSHFSATERMRCLNQVGSRTFRRKATNSNPDATVPNPLSSYEIR